MQVKHKFNFLLSSSHVKHFLSHLSEINIVSSSFNNEVLNSFALTSSNKDEVNSSVLISFNKDVLNSSVSGILDFICSEYSIAAVISNVSGTDDIIELSIPSERKVE